MVEKMWTDAVRHAVALTSAASYSRQDEEDEAFHKVSKALSSMKEDAAALLDHCKDEEIVAVLSVVITVCFRKKVQERRGEFTTLEHLLKQPKWSGLVREQDELLTRLGKLVAGNELLEALLEPKAPMPVGGDAAAGLAAADGTHNLGIMGKKDPKEKMLKGYATMKDLKFEFPNDPVSDKIDRATVGFMSFFDGVTWFSMDWGKSMLEDDTFGDFEQNWDSILRFSLMMYEHPGRRTYRSRIRFMVEKLAQLSPGFAAVVQEYRLKCRQMPWDLVPKVKVEEAPGIKRVALGPECWELNTNRCFHCSANIGIQFLNIIAEVAAEMSADHAHQTLRNSLEHPPPCGFASPAS